VRVSGHEQGAGARRQQGETWVWRLSSSPAGVQVIYHNSHVMYHALV
jgi:hypothetical protein